MSQTASMEASAKHEVSFTTFILSLSMTGLQQLGVKVTDDQADPCINLALAQQTIDILEMLEVKTQGNLSEKEQKLLANILYDLRMRYVEAAQGASC